MAAKCSLSFLLNNNSQEEDNNNFVSSFPDKKENNNIRVNALASNTCYDTSSTTASSCKQTWTTEENFRCFPQATIPPQQQQQQLPQQMLHQLCMHFQMSGTFNPASNSSTSSPSIAQPQQQQLQQLQVLQALHMYLQPKPGQEDEKIISAAMISTKDSNNQIARSGEKISSSSRKRKRGLISNIKDKESRKKKKEEKEEKKQSEGEDSQKEDEEEEALRIEEDEHEEQEEEEEEEGTKKGKRSGKESENENENGEGKRSGLAPTQQRKRATPFQAAYLEYAFRLNPRPDATAKYHISQHINMSTQRISIWFQNKRARMKRSKNPAPSLSDLKGSVVDHSVPPVEHMFAK